MADDPTTSFDRDYDAIEAAVLETARGRWFLAEFARRNKAAETSLILGAIDRLEGSVAPTIRDGDAGAVGDPGWAAILEEFDGAVARICGLGRDEGPDAGIRLLTDALQGAAVEIGAAAERVREVAWALRDAGVPAAAGPLEQAAAEISRICGLQDLAAERARMLLDAVGRLQTRAASGLAALSRPIPEPANPGGAAAASDAPPEMESQSEPDMGSGVTKLRPKMRRST